MNESLIIVVLVIEGKDCGAQAPLEQVRRLNDEAVISELVIEFHAVVFDEFDVLLCVAPFVAALGHAFPVEAVWRIRPGRRHQ